MDPKTTDLSNLVGALKQNLAKVEAENVLLKQSPADAEAENAKLRIEILKLGDRIVGMQAVGSDSQKLNEAWQEAEKWKDSYGQLKAECGNLISGDSGRQELDGAIREAEKWKELFSSLAMNNDRLQAEFANFQDLSRAELSDRDKSIGTLKTEIARLRFDYHRLLAKFDNSQGINEKFDGLVKDYDVCKENLNNCSNGLKDCQSRLDQSLQ